MLSLFSSCNRYIASFCLWFSGLGLILMTFVTGWQVYSRYVLNDSLRWSEQFCLMLMLYFILFAAAAQVRSGSHIGLVIVRESLPGILKKIVMAITHLIVMAFGAGMFFFGTQMAASTWSHVIPTLGLPTGLSYLPFPVAGALFVLFSLENTIKLFTTEAQ
ncbi:MAG: TRAP transporter permease DctQ [Deltaproteobacteria bacterium]|nr:MAG: TRAP transporter permease DctQ [Deltaproteobacteria bacterium]